MGEQTGISWCDSTANLWIGCQKVSEACDHCYAEDLMATSGSRFKRVEWGPDGERSFCKSGWADIKAWNARAKANGGLDPQLGRRRRVFVNSLSDFFDNHPSVKWRGDAWHLIRRSPHVIFILVTKRPQLIKRVLPPFWDEIAERVWLLTTVETQAWADRRIPQLFWAVEHETRPAVLGVSCEPLLGPINLALLQARQVGENLDGWDVLEGAIYRSFQQGRQQKAPAERLDWVIVGGESGKEARPMHPDWLVGLQKQCEHAGVPFHFKQWGEFAADQIGPEDPRSIHHPPGHVIFNRVGKIAAGNKLYGRAIQEVPNVA